MRKRVRSLTVVHRRAPGAVTGLASGCEVWHICVDGTDQHFGDAAEAFALAELAPDPMTREAVELWLSS